MTDSGSFRTYGGAASTDRDISFAGKSLEWCFFRTSVPAIIALLPMKSLALSLFTFTCAAVLAAPPEPGFHAVTIDKKVQIGYEVAVADVDGDKRPDILLADKKQFVWYRNPGAEKVRQPAAWTKFVIAENLTDHDNVCIAAKDIDGDGKCDIAVGAEWNPSDSVNSGAVFYLAPPADRTQRWQPIKFPRVEPTTHRMGWIKLEDGKWGLIVVPLYGRGNNKGEGAPVKVLLYHPPTPLNDPKGEWKSEVIDESMHITSSFLPLATHGTISGTGAFEQYLEFTLPLEKGVVITGREGIPFMFRAKGTWQKWDGLHQILPPSGAGAVAVGEIRLNSTFVATIEPIDGNQLVTYAAAEPGGKITRRVLTNQLIEGCMVKCINNFPSRIVVGWRGSKPKKKGGIALWTPLDEQGEKWRESVIDSGGMACEDLKIADLNGDGKQDIVASGRDTKNVKIYFNDTDR